jgi:phasin
MTSKDRAMAEATTATPPKSKSKPAANPFEMPKFEMPKFEVPKVEMPAAFREFAERGVAQARDTYEKMKAVAEEATDVLETTYSTATRGASDYGLKMIEAARINTNAAFDFAGELITAKTFSEVVELSSAHARKQFETFTQQSKELGALAQKVATETAEPIKNGVNKAFTKVA